MSTATTLQARVGREKQRYDDKLRLVAGCIPYRLKIDVERNFTTGFDDGLEVLMISTPNRHDLVFPKGGWENDETVVEAACREALEEAGVRGIINGKELGIWEFRSKSKQNSCSEEGTCRGYMFALEVTEQLESWPEQDTHNRRWVSVNEAWELCRYDWMQDALKVFLRFLSTNPTLAVTSMSMSDPLPLFCFPKPSETTGRMDSAINAFC